MTGECARCGQTTEQSTLKGVLRWHRQHPCVPAAAPAAASEPPATATEATTASAPTPGPAEAQAASRTAPARATRPTPQLMPEKRVLSWDSPNSSTSSDWDTYAEPVNDWRDDALCAQIGAEDFFPDKGESSRPAKSICAACDVTDQCLRYALDHNERFGIWGGKSERERRRIQRGDTAAAS